MNLNVEKKRFEEIGHEIQSEASPVGIDAKKTHIIIIDKLLKLEEKLNQLEKKVAALEAK